MVDSVVASTMALVLLVIVLRYKWFTQYLYHTALGLPVQPQPDGATTAPVDSTYITLFLSYWLYAQRVYLLPDLYQREFSAFEAVLGDGLTNGSDLPASTIKFEQMIA